MRYHRPSDIDSIALSYPLELDGKTQLLMTPNKSQNVRKVKLVWTWKRHPYGLAFLVLECAIRAIREETTIRHTYL